MKHCYSRSMKRLLVVAIVGSVWSCVTALAQAPRMSTDTLSRKASDLRSILQPIKARLLSGVGVVEIVHLGDSHTQAGYMTQSIRDRLQAKYGDAGRGWLTPFKMARTNQPFDYSITSTGKGWKSETISYVNPANLVGPGGVVLIQTQKAAPVFHVSVRSGSFDRILVCRSARSPVLSVVGSKGVTRVGYGYGTQYVMDTIDFLSPVSKVQLQGSRPTSKSMEYAGFSLHNKNTSGVRYHDIGLNGAMFRVYNRPHFVQNLKLLKPQFMIISLGTNEAIGKCDAEIFRKDVTNLLKALKKELPNTVFVFTTPPVAYNKTGNPVPTIERVHTVLHEVADSENVGLIDLYELMGGFDKGSRLMKSSDYISRDGIHYSVAGYQYLGNLVADELMKALE
ncbi:GDSL-type esterase/lipase family protein [Porphyromonas sp.]|uniref:GDSL-type esterase/lipase family protein n=1 Tax=Porphyromonas sp. TaxID=1924944 RepID=UPI0026DAB9E6|nr:GDSL-type esterase/lipase family protein [Porphyromonas sp.]MDO4771332.1 GDSL-type esterase/lipase family protein [Porphyromonas sp.]